MGLEDGHPQLLRRHEVEREGERCVAVGTGFRLYISSSTPRRLHAAPLEGVGHEAAGMELEVGCCAAAAPLRVEAPHVGAACCDMRHIRWKGTWLQE